MRGFSFYSILAGVTLMAGCASQPEKPVDIAAIEPSERLARAPETGPSAEGPTGIIKAVPMPSAPLRLDRLPSRIIFASCIGQREDQSMWADLTAENADLALLMGDNVYGDVRSRDPSLPELKAAYMRLAASEPFAAFRRSLPLITVWDDHDYGLNDAGADFALKSEAQALFNYVWDVPESSPRRDREGIYDAWTFEEDGKTVQLIMLDTRYFRSELRDTDAFGEPGRERYLPDPDATKTMLGAAQWAWLEETLREPADLRLLVTSIQLIAEGHGYEAWRTLPAEREKLYRILDETGAEDIIVLSGDRHSAGLYRRDDVARIPVFEATSSSFNLPASRWRAEREETRIEPGPHRLGTMIYEPNYGLLDIDWDARTVDIAIKGAGGTVFLSDQLTF